MFEDRGNHLIIKEFENMGIGTIFTDISYGNAKQKTREELIKDFELGDRNLISGYQTHSKNIQVIKEIDKVYFENTDGFITNRKDVVIFTKYADCLPVYIYDPLKEVIGLVHSGWRGTLQEITLEAIKLMEKNYGTDRKNVYFAFGIGIGQENYEVGQEFKDLFSEKFSFDIVTESFMEKNGKLYFDNQKFNYLNLIVNGVEKSKIITNEYCTFRDKRFQSFRRDKENSGRAGGFIYFK
ncbi:peptidoglycan editing factor PgeF [Fusobacterium varium]|uniref:peptidoglycan editing factor PgeF n=1 Tax=Fusobacterium varium TaxID=856 RepID=UPI000E48FD1F|nr:peptidoglycan editing factor PgeF [Fusobacterium varium]MCF2672087.1 peptidoglycan editing factor PgeF [Fusobacterium varium]RHG37128.1 peptidoglycan editing factor PgeF [Fusobacterium varium]